MFSISWKLMNATEEACKTIYMQEVAADHYGESYNLWNRWVDWWRGFAEGWTEDNEYLSLKTRVHRFILRFASNFAKKSFQS
jgi:hypothetical protein